MRGKKSPQVLGFVKRHQSDFKNLKSYKLYCTIIRSL